ncbi:plasmid partitioning/stability family protein [Salmonella enterica subsp. enterica]
MEEDKRLLVWLRPGNNPEDGKALDIMERLPRRSRGEFYRKALVIASALHELDPRLINLLAAQTTTSFNAETLSNILSQTLGIAVERNSSSVETQATGIRAATIIDSDEPAEQKEKILKPSLMMQNLKR